MCTEAEESWLLAPGVGRSWPEEAASSGRAAVLLQHCARPYLRSWVLGAFRWHGNRFVWVMGHHRDFGLIHCLCVGRADTEALPGLML